MSPHTTAVWMLLGAAAIGLWIVQRWPSRAPRSTWRVVGHVVAANVLSSAAPFATLHAVGWLGPLAALMLIAFPAVVYFFVACAWLLLFLQRLLAYR